MIRNVQIENFKSVAKLSLDLGRVTVLIGANGSGKSNILEAITIAAAASQDKLDNEFLATRGIRITSAMFMRSAFKSRSPDANIVSILVNNATNQINDAAYVYFRCRMSIDEASSYPKWQIVNRPTVDRLLVIIDELENALHSSLLANASNNINATNKISEARVKLGKLASAKNNLSAPLETFLIFAPDNATLRIYQTEGQILPLGIRGEGLFSHLKTLDTKKNSVRLSRIKSVLTHIDWFEDFEIPEDLAVADRSIRIKDRFLPEGALFDQRSANEGFLFLLFYITLFVSPDTPAFFAIDNIDTSLNPKLCIALIRQLIVLAKEFDKQVILTTHNPAVLDGLDLNDGEQRLLVVDRNKQGHTRVTRIEPPKQIPGVLPVNLSEAFLRGYIGGLPNNF